MKKGDIVRPKGDGAVYLDGGCFFGYARIEREEKKFSNEVDSFYLVSLKGEVIYNGSFSSFPPELLEVVAPLEMFGEMVETLRDNYTFIRPLAGIDFLRGWYISTPVQVLHAAYRTAYPKD